MMITTSELQFFALQWNSPPSRGTERLLDLWYDEPGQMSIWNRVVLGIEGEARLRRCVSRERKGIEVIRAEYQKLPIRLLLRPTRQDHTAT